MPSSTSSASGDGLCESMVTRWSRGSHEVVTRWSKPLKCQTHRRDWYVKSNTLERLVFVVEHPSETGILVRGLLHAVQHFQRLMRRALRKFGHEVVTR